MDSSYCSKPHWKDYIYEETEAQPSRTPAPALRAGKGSAWGPTQAARLQRPGSPAQMALSGFGAVSPPSGGEQPCLFPFAPFLSRRLTRFCAAVISDQLSVWHLCSRRSPSLWRLVPGEKIKTGGGAVTQGEEGTAGTWSFWLLFGYQCLNLLEITLFIFLLNTNQATLPTHILCQICQLLQGLWTAYK